MREDLFGTSCVVTLPFTAYDSGAQASQAKCPYCFESSCFIIRTGSIDGGFKGCEHAGQPILSVNAEDEPAALFTFFRELPHDRPPLCTLCEERPAVGYGLETCDVCVGKC